MKKLKKDLQEENTRLTADVEKYSFRDGHLRQEFSELLGTPQPTMWGGSSKIERMSWEEIFFRTGELKSDAEYSCLLERWRTCRAELDALKNPKRKKSHEE